MRTVLSFDELGTLWESIKAFRTEGWETTVGAFDCLEIEDSFMPKVKYVKELEKFNSFIKPSVFDCGQRQGGFVYLLESNNTYKIGMTNGSVEKRVQQLQTGNPHTINIVCCSEKVEYYKDYEKNLHLLYDNLKVRSNGEWFSLSGDDVEEIEIFLETVNLTEVIIDNDLFLKNTTSKELNIDVDLFWFFVSRLEGIKNKENCS